MDEQIERVFEQTPEMPAEVAESIRARIRQDTQAVKPMMSGGTYALLFALVFACVSVVFASVLGFSGLHVLSSMAATMILAMLAALAICGGAMAARSMIPGAGGLHNWLLGAGAFAAYEMLVISFFRDYSTRHFMTQGVICLGLGVLCGAFIALPMWLMVRRGFVAEPVRAGATIGLVSGLGGLTALTLHCPVITTPHAGVWHAAVILCWVGIGSGLGRFCRRS